MTPYIYSSYNSLKKSQKISKNNVLYKYLICFSKFSKNLEIFGVYYNNCKYLESYFTQLFLNFKITKHSYQNFLRKNHISLIKETWKTLTSIEFFHW